MKIENPKILEMLNIINNEYLEEGFNIETCGVCSVLNEELLAEINRILNPNIIKDFTIYLKTKFDNGWNGKTNSFILTPKAKEYIKEWNKKL